MAGSILMIHGIGGTAAAFDRLAPAFRALGWRVETPTFRPDKRVGSNPPADLPTLTLADYIAASADAARALKAETGMEPVLMGHSLGGLVVQKLAELGLGRAAVLVTPASPADIIGKPALSQAITFANILFSSKPETKSHKIWPFGFSYGVLNRVARTKHAQIFAGTVYESGKIYEAVAWPDRDPTRSSYVDESKVRLPMLVIGAGQDRATPIAGVRLVAAKYGKVATLKEYPNNAHWIVDEPGTDQVISDIDAWLTGHGVTAGGPLTAATATSVSKAAPRTANSAPARAAAPKPAAAKPKAPAKAPVKPAAPVQAAPPAKAAPVKAAAKPAVKAAPAKAAAKPVAAKPAAKAVAKPKPVKATAKPAAKAAPAKAAAKPVAAKPAAKALAKPMPVKATAKPAAKAAPAKTKAPAAKAPPPKAPPTPPTAKPAAAKTSVAKTAAAKPTVAVKPAPKAQAEKKARPAVAAKPVAKAASPAKPTVKASPAPAAKPPGAKAAAPKAKPAAKPKTKS
jgi:pimeloyl-ACP methyl ester carboxylesterase